MDLKNFQFNKICHFANHPYLCKGLIIILTLEFTTNSLWIIFLFLLILPKNPA
uniref:hypothetical protein n=1 Tax=Candidatus Thiodubiliella endoseptemdiera TaxID=2738886 RepID=UPI0034DF24CB